MNDPAAGPASEPGVRAYGFADITDYIERITYAIWNGPDRNPGLVRRYYTATTPIHADGGDLEGAEAVTANTRARLLAFPDFEGRIDDTIHTGDEDRGYRTSMRWTWRATNLGDSVFGPATGRAVRFTAIANCVVRGETIVEEWLSSNPLALARQLGLSEEEALARSAAAEPVPGRGTRPSWPVEPDRPAERAVAAWEAALNGRDPSAVRRAYHRDAVLSHGPDRRYQGAEEVESWFRSWPERFPGLVWTVDDAYSLPGDDERPDRVATQWTLRGTHRGRPVRISGITHHHLMGGLTVREWTEFDELALLRQCGDPDRSGGTSA